MKRVGKLEITTPSDREIVITRSFDSPRHLVWDCHTKPALVRLWLLGPPGWEMPVCEIDLRVGGVWHWVTEGPDGMRMGYGGVYQEIVRPERLVSTEVFDEPWYEGEAVSRLELAEHEGTTTLTTTVRYASQAVRDAVLQSPMAEGMAFGLDQLENTLKEF